MAGTTPPDPRTETVRILREGRRFIVAAHYNPDGDAVGSTAAMGWLLKELGKDVLLYNASKMPRAFTWLAMPSPLTSELPGWRPDWYIILDSGDAARMGEDLRKAYDPTRTIVIDHHLGNPRYGAVNWIDTTLSSVGEMVGLLARDLGLRLEGPLGVAIYTAIVTDTGHFSYGNTSPQCMEMAADILRAGLDPAVVNGKIDNQFSLGRLRLMTRVLGGLTTHFQGRLGVIHITRSMLGETGTTMEDTDGLINTVRSIRGVRVALSLREDGDGIVKFSLRSSGPDNVQAVAARFGGGGHRNAAGGTIEAPIEDAERALRDAIGEMIDLSPGSDA